MQFDGVCGTSDLNMLSSVQVWHKPKEQSDIIKSKKIEKKKKI